MKLTIDFQNAGKAYSATIEYSAGRRGRMYMPNGDPGYPDDPAEFNFLTLFEIGDDGVERDAMVLIEDEALFNELYDSAYPEACEAYSEKRNCDMEAYYDNKREARLLGEE